jgi:hypothetical protein
MRGLRTSAVQIAKSRHGLGLFAAADIPADAPILTFTGELIGLEEVLASGIDESYPLQVGSKTYLDLDSRSRVVNHSCTPNAGLRSDRILIALRDVQIGEEIFYDYSTTMSERRWQMECRCGEPSCRGIVGDFRDLPIALQQHYLQLGVVQSFIVREFWTALTGRRKEETGDESGDAKAGSFIE